MVDVIGTADRRHAHGQLHGSQAWICVDSAAGKRAAVGQSVWQYWGRFSAVHLGINIHTGICEFVFANGEHIRWHYRPDECKSWVVILGMQSDCKISFTKRNLYKPINLQ